jgi:ankyrin repeat protein/tetratricopeptide (TPR) repeat protein
MLTDKITEQYEENKKRLQERKFDEVISSCTEIIARQPRDLRFQILLIKAYHKNRDRTKAREEAEKTQKLCAKHVRKLKNKRREIKSQGYELLGDSYFYARKRKDALTAYQEVLKIDRANNYVLAQCGIIYRDDFTDSSFTLSQEYFEEALKVDGDAFVLLEYAKLLLTKGEYHSQALDFLQEAIRLDARNPEGYLELGKALRIKGFYEEALGVYHQAITQLVDVPSVIQDKLKSALYQTYIEQIRKTTESRDLESLEQLLLKVIPWGKVEPIRFISSQIVEERKEINVEEHDDEGNGCLHIAVKNQHAHLIGLLCELGFDLEKRNKLEETPLLLSAREGDLDVMIQLLRRGAKKDVVNHEGYNVLQIAAKANQLEIVKDWLQHVGQTQEAIEENRLLFIALEEGHWGLFSYLYQQGSFQAIRDEEGRTLLHKAVSSNNYDAVNRLLKEERLLELFELQNAEGKTAQEYAEEIGASDQIKNILANEKRLRLERKENIGRQAASMANSLVEKMVQETTKGSIKENQDKLREFFTKVISHNSKIREVRQWKQEEADVIAEQIYSQLEPTFVRKKVYSKPEVWAAELKPLITAGIDQWYEESNESISEDQPKEETFARREVESEGSLVKREETEVGSAAEDQVIVSKKCQEFVTHFETQFDIAYGICRAIASGDVISKPDLGDRLSTLAKENAGLAGSITSQAVSLFGFSLPIVGGVSGAAVATGVKAVAEISIYLRDRLRREEAKKLAKLFEPLTPTRRTQLIAITATELALKYRHQLEEIKSGYRGIERFANCAVARVIQYISQSERHTVKTSAASSFVAKTAISLDNLFTRRAIANPLEVRKSLYEIFMDGIIRMKLSEEEEDMVLSTESGEDEMFEQGWTTTGVFGNTGICVVDQDEEKSYYTHKHAKPEVYGYCYGTEEEVKLRGLKLLPKEEEAKANHLMSKVGMFAHHSDADIPTETASKEPGVYSAV